MRRVHRIDISLHRQVLIAGSANQRSSDQLQEWVSKAPPLADLSGVFSTEEHVCVETWLQFSITTRPIRYDPIANKRLDIEGKRITSTVL